VEAVVEVPEVAAVLEVAVVAVPEVVVVHEMRKNNSWENVLMLMGGMDKLVLSVPARCLWIQILQGMFFILILLRLRLNKERGNAIDVSTK
jgi:hypothetical protein